VFRSILCPVDFSVHSERALVQAIALAESSGAHLTLLTVTDPLLDAAARASGTQAVVRAQTQTALGELFERLAAGGSGVTMAVAVAVGEAAAEIVTAAADCKADLIVMGMQGRGSADRWIMGSTTERVLSRTPVPVLAVPPPRS
jgi:nucleotide-binding universal stress UspA family protein